MARAAGMKSYVVAVSDRSRRVFYPSYLSLTQLDDDLAIVNLDGKDRYFDPGSKFCPFGHLLWKHTMSAGIRQIDGGSAITETPSEKYTDSRTQRVANLSLDKDGIATGTVKITYIGAPAVQWRQTSLLGDTESLKRDLRSSMEDLLPHSLEVKVASIDQLTNYEQPLTVVYDVKGSLGSATGKRLILPGDLFEANAKATFPHDKRDVGVYFPYSHMQQDAIRVTFPKDFAVESLPTDGKLQLKTFALYTLSAETAPTSFTIRRNYTLGEVIFLAKEYPELRTFYSGMEAKDQQNVVLKIPPPLEARASSAAN